MSLTTNLKDDTNMRELLEGQLLKFTNVVKGYQYRKFRLEPNKGTLEYFTLDEINKARGSVHLASAVISPSEEDSQTFTVSSACGEIYRLKASNAKERQYWIQRLRATAEQQAKSIAEKNPPLPPRRKVSPTLTPKDVFRSVRKRLTEASSCHHELSCLIDKLPIIGADNKYCNLDLLLLKSTSNAILISLEQCFSVLNKNQIIHSMSSSLTSPLPDISSPLCGFPEEAFSNLGNSPPQTLQRVGSVNKNKNASGEILDIERETIQRDLKSELYKISMLPLLRSFKLGAELTDVRFPTQILEPVSLLEYFANIFSQPQFLIEILDEQNPQKRMVAVIKWYMALFSLNWKDEVLSKPLNPIIGETFHCSWKIPQEEENSYTQVTFLGEQVSHYPPVSAFYVECPEKKISLEGCIGLSSRFLGMSIAVNCHGKMVLKLLSLDEEYSFSLPTLSVQSILSHPWPELGGRILVVCKQTGLSSRITFHTKPYSGGGISHKVTGEIKNKANAVVCKIYGQFLGKVEFNHINEQSDEFQEVNLSKLIRSPKYVRPVEQQDECESRKLWAQVIDPLKAEEFELAELNRQKIEASQHQLDEERKEQNRPYLGKLFKKDGEFWEYKYPLIIN